MKIPDHRCRWLISGEMYSVPAAYCWKPGKYTATNGRDYFDVCAEHSKYYKGHVDYKIYPVDHKLVIMT